MAARYVEVYVAISAREAELFNLTSEEDDSTQPSSKCGIVYFIAACEAKRGSGSVQYSCEGLQEEDDMLAPSIV